jgi:hypothetical protein
MVGLVQQALKRLFYNELIEFRIRFNPAPGQDLHQEEAERMEIFPAVLDGIIWGGGHGTREWQVVE